MWDMVSTTREDGVLVIALAGKWIGGKENQQLSDLVRGELMGGGSKIVLDLEFVEWMSSLGIGVLTAVLVSSQSAQAKLALANVPPIVKEVLEISCLDKLFLSAKSRQDAKQLIS